MPRRLYGTSFFGVLKAPVMRDWKFQRRYGTHDVSLSQNGVRLVLCIKCSNDNDNDNERQRHSD